MNGSHKSDLEVWKIGGNSKQGHATAIMAEMTHLSPSLSGDILLDIANGRAAIVSAHCVQLTHKGDRLEGTAAVDHPLLLAPHIHSWIIGLARGQSSLSVIAAQGPNATSK